MRKCTILLLVLSAMLCDAGENDKPGLGMWVWPQNAFNTAAARRELLDFCAKEGISHVDQHVRIEIRSAALSIANADALTALVVAAQKQGMTVNALRGGRDLFLEGNHDETLRGLRAIVAFDKRLPSTAHLAGVKYDVEPYGLDVWKAGGQQRTKVILDYLSFLQKAKALLAKEAPHIMLCVDVPFWWDKKEFVVTFGGKEKLLVHHVQDLTDYIGIMSYRPSSKQVLECVRQELKYAATTGKTVCPGLETGVLEGKENRISFSGHPTSVFREAVDELQQAVSGSKAVRCIMLHHYGSLFTYLGETPNKPDAGDGK